ncbi:clasp N terminal-domain-containing protein [Massariosphaeria phaeospora]|uniref:Clasp N terminal-domain-containing protein n=1 Tax=Massariosphaeria phaeospora TaxID=100035 RepID=A0A7C8I8K3_9PLEO|nr:clasp N terminal-domain-containing protein [Massariosphaeria phaeospora]
MEEQSAALLAALKKPSSNVDTRLQLFNNLKSAIKHNRVPESCQDPIFECIRIAISAATSAALVSTGFSTLSHFIKRLQLQKETDVLTFHSSQLLAILNDRLGDARESHRNATSQLLADLYPLCHAEIEALMHSAMKGTNPRAKETSMQWVVKMNQTESLPFRSYVPQLVANLEDADAGVRETAKTAAVELFRHAPEHAKANLKKQLTSLNVRKTIASYITSHLDEGMSAEAEMLPPPPTARPISVARPESVQPASGLGNSLLSEAPPPAEAVTMDPLNIYTQRELDDIFRAMAPPFEGRESEGNWSARDKNTTKLRRITKGNAPSEFHSAYVAGIKATLDGILKVANSLRTTMSTNGCQLIQEVAKTLGPAIDTMAEILLQSFIKMCAATKNIAAQNGNATVEAIISNVSYTTRLLQHVSMASQDKNVQPRTYSANWAKILIRKHKSALEHSGGFDTIEKILKKGLADANPKVREGFRSTYWTFALVWPQRAEMMFDTLEKREKSALEKDPNNPNASLASSQTSVASFSKSVGAGSTAATRNALKDKIAEQRRAKLAATKGVPERPNSAQASYTPVKSQSAKSLTSRNASNASAASSGLARPPSAMSGNSTKSLSANPAGTGLMGGTARRPVRRPELNRPATADPYAMRRAGKNVTPSMTPEKTPAVTTVKKSVATGTKSTARPRSHTQTSPNISPIRSKSRIGEPTTHPPTPSKDEDLTIVKPFVRSQSHHDPGTIPFRQRNGMDGNLSVDNEAVDVGDDDNFTMVIPNLARPTTQPAQRSPPKSAPSPDRLAAPSPRVSPLKSPKSMGDIHSPSLGLSRSPRMRSPDRPSTRGTDAQDEVQVYEDPFVGDEPNASGSEFDKPVLEELPLNEKSAERRLSIESSNSTTIMGDVSEERVRGHLKTTSTGSVMHTDAAEANRAEVIKNRQLLDSGIRKVQTRTVEAHMFRRLQDMIKSNQDVWGANDQKFAELLLATLDYLEAPAENLKAPPAKAANLKVQALATIRAMLSLYRKETAKYFSRVLCSILHTKAQYDNASHMATDLEATADEIIRYGQTADCINAVVALIEDAPNNNTSNSSPTSSPQSKASTASTDSSCVVSNRTITMALATLASLIHISGAKNVSLSPEQTARLGKLAVRCLDDTDPDVRKADVEVCLALHERIGAGKEAFWKAVAGAREQHLNLITYYLAKRGKA